MGMFLILLLALTAHAQQEPTFRTGVALVKVDVQVLAGKRLVGDLTKDDFRVLDEGQSREIVYFGRESEPLWVMLLLDVSGSMERHVQQMADASRRALGALRTGDQLGITLFSRETRVHQAFTDDLKKAGGMIKWAVRQRGLGSGSRINASILSTGDHVREKLAGQSGRRAILVLTDNKAMNYQVPDEKVLAALWGADAVLNAIVIGGAKPPKAIRNDLVVNPDFTPSDVFRLARETGGDVIRANKAGDAFSLLMERIRTRYSIHYRAPEARPGSFRRIEVRLGGDAARRYRKAEVRARRGYYYPEEPESAAGGS